MTQEEKAKELVEKLKPLAASWIETGDMGKHENAKKAALICVDVVQKVVELDSKYSTRPEYWNSVKEAISNL